MPSEGQNRRFPPPWRVEKYNAESFRVLDGFTRIVRLGEGLSVTGRLSDAAMDRTMDALRQCRNKLREHDPARMRLIATEACRAASNGAAMARSAAPGPPRTTGFASGITDEAKRRNAAAFGCGRRLR